MKIEVERGVITFSSLCIENTTPIFCTEIVAHSRATTTVYIFEDSMLLVAVIYVAEHEQD